MKKLTIIGGGPAGYAAALYASNFELEITLIESDTLGGTCLNRGCIPAKYWLHVAELNHEIDNSKDFGIEITGKNIDWKATAQKRLDTVNKLVSGIGMLLKSKKVDVIEGWGTIKDSNKVIVKTIEGKEEEISTDYILLATGSKPREIPNINVDGEFVITSDTALDSSRFAYFISEKLNVNMKEVEAWTLGSHGETMVPAPSQCKVNGKPLTELLTNDEIDELVKRTSDGGAEIVALLKTGSAYFAPSSAAATMVKSIISDSNNVLPSCTWVSGEYGINDVYLGVPTKLGKDGVTEIVELDLNSEELENLKSAADSVKQKVLELNNLKTQ